MLYWTIIGALLITAGIVGHAQANPPVPSPIYTTYTYSYIAPPDGSSTETTNETPNCPTGLHVINAGVQSSQADPSWPGGPTGGWASLNLGPDAPPDVNTPDNVGSFHYGVPRPQDGPSFSYSYWRIPVKVHHPIDSVGNVYPINVTYWLICVQ